MNVRVKLGKNEKSLNDTWDVSFVECVSTPFTNSRFNFRNVQFPKCYHFYIFTYKSFQSHSHHNNVFPLHLYIKVFLIQNCYLKKDSLFDLVIHVSVNIKRVIKIFSSCIHGKNPIYQIRINKRLFSLVSELKVKHKK